MAVKYLIHYKIITHHMSGNKVTEHNSMLSINKEELSSVAQLRNKIKKKLESNQKLVICTPFEVWE